MPNIKKSTVLVAVVVLVTVFTYYRYATKAFQAPKNEEAVPMAEPPVAKKTDDGQPVGTREVSALVSYDVPAAETTHHVRFTLILDAEGKVTGVKLVETPTNVASEKQAEFSEKLAVVIKGKKLSELSAVDRVGTSSLTTNAFNSVLDTLKSQI